MQIKETLSQGLKREFEVTIPSSEIEKKLDARLEGIGKRVKIPGFRPGKVPLSLLKQRYKSEALSEVVEDCFQKGTQQALKDKDIKPALKPKIAIKSYEEGKDLVFEVALEILPTIGEIKLDGLSFEKLTVSISPEAISNVIEGFAKRNRKTRPLTTLRKTQKGDIAIIDFEGFIDGIPIEGGSDKNHPLELGSGSFIPGFEDQLIGQEKGARVDVKVTFPKDYLNKDYANKLAHFNVVITDIHEADPIVFDEALAKDLGFESMEAIRASAEKSISKDFVAQSFLNIKRHVLDALAERFTFAVPENMVDLEFENIWRQLCQELGIDQSKAANTNAEDSKVTKTFEEATGRSEEELKLEYKAIAERRVRLGILLAEIGNRNNISVANQELMEALMARAREFPGQEREVFDFYRNNESAMSTLRAPIFENKVVEFILGQSKVTEKQVTPEEFEKLIIREEEEAEKKITSTAKKSKKSSSKKDA